MNSFQFTDNKIKFKFNKSYWIVVVIFLFVFSLIFLATNWNSNDEIRTSIGQIIIWFLIIYIIKFGKILTYPIFWEIKFYKKKLGIVNTNKYNIFKYLFPFKKNINRKEIKEFAIINETIKEGTLIKTKYKIKKYIQLVVELENGKIFKILSIDESDKKSLNDIFSIGELLSEKYNIELKNKLENEIQQTNKQHAVQQ